MVPPVGNGSPCIRTSTGPARPGRTSDSDGTASSFGRGAGSVFFLSRLTELRWMVSEPRQPRHARYARRRRCHRTVTRKRDFGDNDQTVESGVKPDQPAPTNHHRLVCRLSLDICGHGSLIELDVSGPGCHPRPEEWSENVHFGARERLSCGWQRRHGAGLAGYVRARAPVARCSF